MITARDLTKLHELLDPLIPAEWFAGPVTLSADDDEILIVGELSAQSPGGADPQAFREATRGQRVKVAQKLEAAMRRSISWGVHADGVTTLFTGLGVPVMTRLRVGEREALDTLVAAGVARSRSDAVAWCVRFVAQREAAWLGELRTTLEGVSKVRAEGPTLA